MQNNKFINLLSEFSIPLLSGVILAILWANLNYESYQQFLNQPLIDSFTILGHPITFHFLMNDIFMVFFFGIATVEITQAVLPGGSLNPISKAINPLFATLGGIFGPVAVYFLLCYLFNTPEAYNGWGIPTATDIALAWLVARLVFGAKHPAVSFLLLLAVADDAIGLGIIAIFYPDPSHPVQPIYLLFVLAGMLSCFLLKKFQVKSFWAYLLIGGGLSWSGLILAYLHPALALVPIIPFLPHSKSRHGQLFEDEKEDESSLVKLEHTFKIPVDIGLLGFGLANAGVAFSSVNVVTWIVLLSLLIGKTFGITLFSYVGKLLGFPLPNGMDFKALVLAGGIAAIGLTVALFVAGEAFQNPILQGGAKMGAILSGLIALKAILAGKILKIEKVN